MSACRVRCVWGRYIVRGLRDGGCDAGSGGLKDEYAVDEVASEGVTVLAVSVVAAE